MADRPATLLEGIIGVEKARECQTEIGTRIRPDDDPKLQSDLLQSIVTRYVKQSKPKLRDITQLLPSLDAKGVYDMAFGLLIDNLLHAMRETDGK